MVHVLVHEVLRGHLVALLVCALLLAQEVALFPFEFALGEPIQANTLQFLQNGRQSALDTGGVHPAGERQDVQMFHVGRTAGVGQQVGRIGDLRPLGQPRVQHHEGESLHHHASKCRMVLTRIGSELTDENELVSGRLRVSEYLDPWRLVSGDVEVRPVSGGSGGGALLGGFSLRRRSEVLFDFGFDHTDVEGTDGHDCHQVRSVPAFVVVSENLSGGGFDDLGQPYGTALQVERVAEQQDEQIVLKARTKPLVEAPLLQHDSPFQIDLFGIERHRVGPVAQNPKCSLGDLWVIGRDFQEIEGVIEAGPRVHVMSKSASDRLEVADDFLLGESLGPIEGHVLYEVRQTSLFLSFVN